MMKTVRIDRDSWHYKVARFGGFNSDFSNHDVCTYMRHILQAVIGSAFLGVLLAGATISLALIFGDLIGWLVFIVINGWISPVEWALVGLMILSIVGTVGFFYAFFKGTKHAAATALQNDIVRAAWGSLHNKICARSEIK